MSAIKESTSPMDQLVDLEFHHVGIVVKKIDDALQHFSKLFGKNQVSPTFFVSSQNVNVCFVKNGTNSFIELVEPVGEQSVVNNLLEKRISYYHMAYHTQDIKDTISKMESLGYKQLNLFNSEAFSGKLCAFVFSPEGLLVELIEK